MVYTNRIFDADECLQLGLLNYLVEDERLDRFAVEKAYLIASQVQCLDSGGEAERGSAAAAGGGGLGRGPLSFCRSGRFSRRCRFVCREATAPFPLAPKLSSLELHCTV